MAPIQYASLLERRDDPPVKQGALPGMKRGIAIGVAASVCLILIALLAHFAVKRRKNLKAQQQQQPTMTSNTKDEQDWPREKSWGPEASWSPQPPPVEADVRTIHEMDAGQDGHPVPELPTKIHVQGAQELDEGEGKGGDREWERWSAVLGSQPPKEVAAEDAIRSGSSHRQVPTLQISPPEVSPLMSASPLGVSPLGVSPLEEAYLPQSPRSPRNWI